MAQGGELAMPSAVGSSESELAMPAAARSSVVHIDADAGTLGSRLGAGGLRGDPGAVYVNLGEFAGQARPGAGRGDDFVHGVLRGDLGLMHGNSGTIAPQLRHVAGREDEQLMALLRDGHGAVYDSSGNFGRQVRAGEGIVAALADPNTGAQYCAVGTPAERLRRLLPVAGIAASSVAATGLAGGTAPPAAAFGFFALLLCGLSLVTIHVLRA